MKKSLSFLLYFLWVITLHSQKPFYHKNKKISWVGQTEFTYYLEHYDRLNFEPTTEWQKETRTIKIDPYATCEFGNEKYFTNFIINEVLEGRRKVFDLEGDLMTNQQINDAFGKTTTDTSIIIDPETRQQRFIVTRTEPRYQISSFKVRQWWYYDKTTASLNSTVRAIAPIMEKEKKDGSTTKRVLFWIDMQQDAQKDYHYNDPFVIWAKETVSSLSFKKIKKVKGRTKKTLKNYLYKNPVEGKVATLSNDSWYSYCAAPIDKEEVAKMFEASVDTVITFDPETFQEATTIIKNSKTDYKDIDYYRVLQHWYFDKSTNTLASKVISIGPLKDIKDEKGKLKYRRALFYIPSSQ
ncbi:MAG: hypothetical protein AAF573_12460 [Bacteroidota bacterium]